MATFEGTSPTFDTGTGGTTPTPGTEEGYDLYTSILVAGDIMNPRLSTIPAGFRRGLQYLLDGTTYYRFLAIDRVSETISTSLTDPTGANIIYTKTY